MTEHARPIQASQPLVKSRSKGRVRMRARWQPAEASWMRLRPVKGSRAACYASCPSSPMLVTHGSMLEQSSGCVCMLCNT